MEWSGCSIGRKRLIKDGTHTQAGGRVASGKGQKQGGRVQEMNHRNTKYHMKVL